MENSLYEFVFFRSFFPQLIFRPPLDHYDVIIHLHNRLLSRRTQALDRVKHSTEETSSSSPSVLLPVVNFDPSRLYLEELKVRVDFSCNIKRTLTIDKPNIAWLKFKMFMKFIFFQEAFSDVAMFFHDVYGGDIIGVVWKPHSFEPAPFKVQSPFIL